MKAVFCGSQDCAAIKFLFMHQEKDGCPYEHRCKVERGSQYGNNSTLCYVRFQYGKNSTLCYVSAKIVSVKLKIRFESSTACTVKLSNYRTVKQ